MARYVIGDIQGCCSGFDSLLKRVSFDPEKDRLILLGDVINRGPDSLQTLKKIYELRDSISIVLGNHDLNTMAVLAGYREIKPRDTISALINDTIGIELVHWLRSQPLLLVEDHYVFCHAGIYPLWTLEEAQQRANEVEAVLQGPNYKKLLKNMYGPKPTRWRDELKGWKRYRFILNAFTRMRYISGKGNLDHECSTQLGSQPKNLVPWFLFPNRLSYSQTTVIGHWSTLGLHIDNTIACLDTGCVWGGKLTAAELDTNPLKLYSVNC